MVNRRFNKTLHVRPPALIFDDLKTDSEGTVRLSFAERKLWVNSHWEIALSKLTVFNDDIPNVLEGQEWLIFSSNDGSKVKIDFPECRIAFLDKLIETLQAIQPHVTITRVGDTRTLEITFDNCHTVEMSLGLAQALHIYDSMRGTFSRFLWLFNPDYTFTGGLNSVSINVPPNAANNLINVPPIAANNLNNAQAQIEPLRLPYSGNTFIYRHISPNSSQAIWVYCNLIEDEFVSSQMQPLLNIAAIDATQVQTNYQAKFLQYKRVKQGKMTFDSAELTLADSTGRPLKGVRVMAELSLRRRSMH